MFLQINKRIFTEFGGHYFPFAVGAEGGNQSANVLVGRGRALKEYLVSWHSRNHQTSSLADYVNQTVSYVSIDFIQHYVKTEVIDFASIDAGFVISLGKVFLQ